MDRPARTQSICTSGASPSSATPHQVRSPITEPNCRYSAGGKPPPRPRRTVSMVTGPGGALIEIAMIAPARAVVSMMCAEIKKTPTRARPNLGAGGRRGPNLVFGCSACYFRRHAQYSTSGAKLARPKFVVKLQFSSRQHRFRRLAQADPVLARPSLYGQISGFLRQARLHQTALGPVDHVTRLQAVAQFRDLARGGLG